MFSNLLGFFHKKEKMKSKRFWCVCLSFLLIELSRFAQNKKNKCIKDHVIRHQGSRVIVFNATFNNISAISSLGKRTNSYITYTVEFKIQNLISPSLLIVNNMLMVRAPCAASVKCHIFFFFFFFMDRNDIMKISRFLCNLMKRMSYYTCDLSNFISLFNAHICYFLILIYQLQKIIH